MLTKELIKDIYKKIPEQNVLTEIEERYVYACDASEMKEVSQLPDAVVFVESIEQVQEIVKLANKYKTPIICRGAGTNTVGACVPVHGGIILNFSKMNKILEINPVNMTAKVQPGVVVGDFQKQVENFGLYYPPDPSNLKISTMGGSVAQNSAGARGFKYGCTRDYVIDLLVVMADGSLVRTGSNTIKNAAGYNLGSLFVGSEGTLGIVVEITVKLITKPETSQVLLAYFDSVDSAVKSVNSIIKQQICPTTIDLMDKNAIRTVEEYKKCGLICDKEAALIIEVDGFKTVVEAQMTLICDILKQNEASNIKYAKKKEDAEQIWDARHSSMSACTQLRPNVTTDDVVVPRENLAILVKGIQKICEKYNLLICMVGHVGDGSVHPQIPIDINDKSEYERYKLAKSEIYNLTAKLGGIISGEHGIGLLKKTHLPKVIDNGAIDYMRQIKKIFDPNNILNPYKIF